MRHSVLKWVWPVLRLFAEFFCFVYFFFFFGHGHSVSPWPGSQVARFPTGQHQAKGWTMSDRHQRSPWNRALRVVKQWKVTAYLNQRAICAADSALRELEPWFKFSANCLVTSKQSHFVEKNTYLVMKIFTISAQIAMEQSCSVRYVMISWNGIIYPSVCILLQIKVCFFGLVRTLKNMKLALAQLPFTWNSTMEELCTMFGKKNK